ncbi:MAG: hypothetical protein AAFX44_04060 [Pseudomonadota bacterium]
MTEVLSEALQELEDRVRDEVRRTLNDADSDESRQLDFARHAEDYRTWRRMGEAPGHVHTLADKIGESVSPSMSRDTLTRELVIMLERIYRDLDSGRPEIPPDPEQT